MRTQEWFEGWIPRAAARIHRDVAQGSLSLGTLWGALGEITEVKID